MNKILNVAYAKNSTDEIVVYTFLNVREKITSFCQALKRCTQKKVGSFFSVSRCRCDSNWKWNCSFTGHAAKLMKWRRQVSEALDAQSVAIFMNEKHALADKDLQSITSIRTEDIKAAERLLVIVSNQPFEFYSHFLDALDASGHQHVRELLETDNIQGTRQIYSIL